MNSSWSGEALRVDWQELNGACHVCGVSIEDTVISRHAWQVTQRYLVAGEPAWQAVSWKLHAATKQQLVFAAPLASVQGVAVELRLRFGHAARQAAGLSFRGLSVELSTSADVPLPGEVRLVLPLELSGWLGCVQDLYTASKADLIGPAWKGFHHGNWQGQRSPLEFAASAAAVFWGRLGSVSQSFASAARFDPERGPLFTYTFGFSSVCRWESPDLALLLAARGGAADPRDLWAHLFVDESERFRRDAGVVREEVLPMANIPIDGGTPGCAPRETLRIQGTFDEYGPAALAHCQQLNCRRLLVGSPWISQRTEGLSFKALPSITYDSRCGTLDVEVSPRYGGRAAFRRFCDQAHAAGVEVYCWYPAFHLSNFSAYLTQHPDWVLRKADGSAFTHVYFHISAISARLEVQEHFLRRLAELREECRFDGLWLDSFNGMPFMSMDFYRRQGVDQTSEAIDMIRRLQELGIHVINEGFSPFGARGDGETSFFIGQEDMAVETSLFTYFSSNPRVLDGDTYFRFLAHKAPLTLAAEHVPAHRRAELARLNGAFTQVVALMQYRQHLAADQGVVWLSAGVVRVVFAYRHGALRLSHAAGVQDLIADRVASREGDATVLEAGHIYRVDLADAGGDRGNVTSRRSGLATLGTCRR
jgi:hypothetical protein